MDKETGYTTPQEGGHASDGALSLETPEQEAARLAALAEDMIAQVEEASFSHPESVDAHELSNIRRTLGIRSVDERLVSGRAISEGMVSPERGDAQAQVAAIEAFRRDEHPRSPEERFVSSRAGSEGNVSPERGDIAAQLAEIKRIQDQEWAERYRDATGKEATGKDIAFLRAINTASDLESLRRHLEEVGDIVSPKDGHVYTLNDQFAIISRLTGVTDPNLQSITNSYGLRDAVRKFLSA